MRLRHFEYVPKCSVAGCDHPAAYKIAAPWSDGSARELKNYGVCCVEHRDHELALARKRREGLRLAEGETVGPVGLYKLTPGSLDSQLTKVGEGKSSH